jgi:class 3 adenylate cyclase
VSELELDSYEERYVAFADILGFEALVNSADNSQEQRFQIADALRAVQRTSAPQDGETDLRVHYFSDCVSASARNTPEGLWHLLLSMDSLAWNLLQKDILVRGGVAIGGVFVADDIVFGTGVNKAYKLESQIARYPRIGLSKEVMFAINEAAQEHDWAAAYAGHRVRRDRDGVYNLHYLNDLAAANHHPKRTLDQESPNSPWIAVGRGVRDQIQRRIDLEMENPHVYEKVRWLAEYWNEAMIAGRDEKLLHIGSVKLPEESWGTPTPLPFRHL